MSCEVCFLTESKYKCVCLLKYCSVACFKTHKATQSCEKFVAEPEKTYVSSASMYLGGPLRAVGPTFTVPLRNSVWGKTSSQKIDAGFHASPISPHGTHYPKWYFDLEYSNPHSFVFHGAPRQSDAVSKRRDYPREDIVPPRLLEYLKTSRPLRESLKNPHLRQLLKSLASEKDPSKLLDNFMKEPLFTEFADACLDVIEPQDE